MKQEGCIIEYRQGSSDECREILQALCEGFVEANVVMLPTMPEVDIRYEEPRLHDRKGQTVALANQVAVRRRATCVEWACIRCASNRIDGVSCGVRIIDIVDVDGRPVAYNYHAVLEYPDGRREDVTAELQGGPSTGNWYEGAGHCCGDCALGHACPGDAA